MMPCHVRYLLLVLIIVLTAPPVYALTQEQEAQIARIGSLSIEELAASVETTLQEKYPNANWKGYRFPQYVYTSKPIEIAYKVAVKRPDLLRKVKCLCYCEDAKGHENLLYCFYRGGVAGGAFDPHAVGCSLCYTQALLSFMWAEAGVPEDKIDGIMNKK